MKAFSLFLLVAAASTVFAEPILGPVAPTTQTVGTTFTVDIDISNVTDLYAWQADLNYDSSMLSLVSISEGSFLSNAGPTFFIAGTNDPKLGVIPNNADTLYTYIPGATGSGTLFSAEFKAINTGLAVLTLGDVTLLDSNLASIDSLQVGSVVDITPPTFGGGAASEPSTVGLVLLSASLLLAVMRRRGAVQRLCLNRFLISGSRT